MSVTSSNGFYPTFENGGFWEYYKDLERQFSDFLIYVPYLSGNEGTYSFRLANLMVTIGAHIDSAFKEIIKHPFFSNFPDMLTPTYSNGRSRFHNITDFYPVSEEYNLPSLKVTFKRLPNREDLYPFQGYVRQNNGSPYWWENYNNIKHHFDMCFKEATLATVRDALAGAFLLNVIHRPARKRLFDNGLLTPKYQQGTTFFETYNDLFDGEPMFSDRKLEVKTNNPFKIETGIFSFDYEGISLRR
jgi:hypothetical protein